jgi:hypothetical protein
MASVAKVRESPFGPGRPPIASRTDGDGADQGQMVALRARFGSDHPALIAVGARRRGSPH